MFLTTLFGHQAVSKVQTETVLIALFLFASATIVNARVDSSYCRPYDPDPDPDVGDNKVPPLLFMGWTWDTLYYVTPRNLSYSFDYFDAALSYCGRFGMTVASIRTLCEFAIVERWFFDKYPTTYSFWVDGMRLGRYRGPTWLAGGPIDMSQYGYNIDYVGGPYPPGGYDLIPYPWVNFLKVTRNCPAYTAGPTNPCTQTPIYPDVNFFWEDPRVENGVICQRPIIYYEKEDDNDDGVIFDEERYKLAQKIKQGENSINDQESKKTSKEDDDTDDEDERKVRENKIEDDTDDEKEDDDK